MLRLHLFKHEKSEHHNTFIFFDFRFRFIRITFSVLSDINYYTYDYYTYELQEGETVTLSAEEMDVIIKEGLLQYMFGKVKIYSITNHFGQHALSVDNKLAISYESFVNCMEKRFVERVIISGIIERKMIYKIKQSNVYKELALYEQLIDQNKSSNVQKRYIFLVVFVIFFSAVIYLIIKDSNTDEEINL